MRRRDEDKGFLNVIVYFRVKGQWQFGMVYRTYDLEETKRVAEVERGFGHDKGNFRTVIAYVDSHSRQAMDELNKAQIAKFTKEDEINGTR